MKPVSRVAPPQPWQPGQPRPATHPGSPSARGARERDASSGMLSDEALPDVALGLPSPDTPTGSGSDGDDNDGGQGQQGQQEAAGPGVPASDPGQAAVVRLGGLIAAFCLHPAAVDDQWSIRIPLDSEVLQQCVLYLHFVRHALHIRFETPDWETRALLERHARTLAEQLRADLPGLQDVSVIT